MMKHRYRRRAAMYVIIVGCTLVVATVGVSAITLTRIERIQNQTTGDFLQAQLYARSAIEIGLLQIHDDPDWRSTMPNGAWRSNAPIGTGYYTLHGVDPADSDLTDDDAEAVQLTGIGMEGAARFALRTLVQVTPVPLSCLEVSMHAGDDIRVDAGFLYGDQIVSANDRIESANASEIYPAAESVNGFGGDVGPGQTTSPVPPRDLPGVDVFDYYEARGTWISAASLPQENGRATIAGRLLGPNHNPFGSTNPDGIYVIDCQNQDVQIRNSRIIGTLVLLDAGARSAAYESVNWSANAPNYPALLVRGSFNLILTDNPIVESDLGVNLNPAGAEFNLEADLSLDDIYPCEINGLIYVSEDLATDATAPPYQYEDTISNTINGVVIAGTSILPSTATFNLNYSADFFDYPPPGFRAGLNYTLARGSWEQSAN